MKKYMILGCVGLAMMGCGDRDDHALVCDCGGHVVRMQFVENGDRMIGTIDGAAVKLHHAVAASGAKYDGTHNGNAVTMWGRGNDWIMIQDDDMVLECVHK